MSRAARGACASFVHRRSARIIIYLGGWPVASLSLLARAGLPRRERERSKRRAELVVFALPQAGGSHTAPPRVLRARSFRDFLARRCDALWPRLDHGSRSRSRGADGAADSAADDAADSAADGAADGGGFVRLMFDLADPPHPSVRVAIASALERLPRGGGGGGGGAVAGVVLAIGPERGWTDDEVSNGMSHKDRVS